jgi:hypothetical protein
MKLPARPMASSPPDSSTPSPPAGRSFITRATSSAAAASSAIPIPSWIFCRGQRATTPAPSHAPATAAPIMSTSVVKLTSMICV